MRRSGPDAREDGYDNWSRTVLDVPKGYGFIKPDDGGVDVLVDICAVERAGMACLDQGQRLSFEVMRDERIGRSCAENLNESFCLFPNIILPESNADGLAGAPGAPGL